MKIVFQENQRHRLFLTSDPHFGHGNIIKYCNRPFKSKDEMNQVLVSNWNSKVPKNGITFIVGDFAFLHVDESLAFLKQLNGDKILISGNHDEHNLRDERFRKAFTGIYDLVDLKVYGKGKAVDNIVVCHYPISSWNRKFHGSKMFHGHCHGTHRIVHNQIDVGVDTMNFEPKNIDEVLALVEDQNVRICPEWEESIDRNL